MFHDMRQWWCGRAVPMAGVASVMVAPEDRGRGIARRLMTALLDEVAARGYPLSALYPATMPLYRSLGWELAGVRDTAVIPARSLRDLVPPDPVIPAAGPDVTAGSPRLRRAAPGDAEAVISVIGRVHEAARDCGPITWDAASVAGWLADPDLYAYLCDDGFLIYRWHTGTTPCSSRAPRRSPRRPSARSGLTSARTPRSRSGYTHGSARPTRSGG